MPYRLFRAEEDFLDRSPTKQLSLDLQGLFFYSLGVLLWVCLLTLMARRLVSVSPIERLGLRILMDTILVTWLALMLGRLAQKLPAYVLVPVRPTAPSQVKPVVAQPPATSPPPFQPQPVPPEKQAPVGSRELPPVASQHHQTAPGNTPSVAARIPQTAPVAVPAPAAPTAPPALKPEGKPTQPAAAAMASATGHQPVPDTFFGDLLDFLPPDDEDAESGSPLLDVGLFGVSTLENPDHIHSLVRVNPGHPNLGRNPTQALAAAITASLNTRERKPL